MYTLKEWIVAANQKLHNAGVSSAALDAQIIAEHVLHKNRAHLLAHVEMPITNGQKASLDKLLAERSTRKPIAYITHKAYFYGRSYYVNQKVLIPRPESESFINLLLLKHNGIGSLIDIGTGSGVLGITAKLLLPHVSVTCSDISKPAIRVAKRNAEDHKVSIIFKNQSLLDNNNYNVIFANLPYVPSDFPLTNELAYEPSLALHANQRGMHYYHQLWIQIAQLSNKPLFVFTESLLSQHDEMVMLARKNEYKLDSTESLVQVFVKEAAEA